jgi:hypothetical protein
MNEWKFKKIGIYTLRFINKAVCLSEYAVPDGGYWLVNWKGCCILWPNFRYSPWNFVERLLRSNRSNANWQGKPKYSEKTCTSVIFSITYPTLSDLGSNPGRRGRKPAINRLSYGTAKVDRMFRKKIHYKNWKEKGTWWGELRGTYLQTENWSHFLFKEKNVSGWCSGNSVELLGSNPGRNIDHPDRTFVDFLTPSRQMLR